MGKKIYWALVGLLAICGMAMVIYFGIQPRPIPKIKLSQFETPTVLANSLLLRLREEIQKSPVLFLGVQSERPEQIEVWKQFFIHNQEPGMKYDLIVADQFLPGIDLLEPQEKMASKELATELIAGVEAARAAGKRVAIVVPTFYSAQLIHGNLANIYKQTTGQVPMSLSLSEFPRSREQEKTMLNPCIVAGVDQTGFGPFGCMLVQTARANYRKHFQAGKYVGLVDQVGLKDFLVLYALEN